jgi:hypothetical protein
MDENPLMRQFAQGEIAIWYEENGGVHIKTYEPHGDPVEITEDEAREIAQWLMFISGQLSG